MTEISTEPYPGNVNTNPAKKQLPKSSRQRFKPQLSCNFCRNRKLKCDRGLPCEQCAKRDLSSSCTYVQGSLRDNNSQVQKNRGEPKDVRSQIRNLEEMVISLMNQSPKRVSQSADTISATSETLELAFKGSNILDNGLSSETSTGRGSDNYAESFGRISIEDDGPSYVGSAHWAAILDSIAGLKDQLEYSNHSSGSNAEVPLSPGPDLLVGSVRCASRAEILSSIPAKNVVDRLVETYFTTPDIGNSMLHQLTFEKEVEAFFNSPRETPIMWIGLLFGVMCLSTYFEHMSQVPVTNSISTQALNHPLETMDLFRERTVQCLVLGKYTSPGPYTLETLMLYYVSDHFRTTDTQAGAWMVFGLVVRAAMRLGYHRDPSHTRYFSPFQGQMRRRLWASIVHLDLLTSLQVGLPRMIKEGMYDTKPPLNLLDQDFGEETKVLPPPRPESVLTPIGYANAKHRISTVLGKIVDQANITSSISYEEVMDLDKQLYEVHQLVPEPLKVRTMKDFDSALAIITLRKFAVEMTYQKSRCILHRKFFLHQTKNKESHFYSTKECIEASMWILQGQIIMDKLSQPGQQLYTHKWKSSSLLAQDFLLAAMLLCLYLGHTIAIGPSRTKILNSSIQIEFTNEEIIHSLQRSLHFWQEKSSSSKEAMKAAKALESMLSRVKTPGLTSTKDHHRTDEEAKLDDCMLRYDDRDEQTAQPYPTLMASDIISASQVGGTQLSASGCLDPSSGSSEETAAGYVNWDSWDNQFCSDSIGQFPLDFTDFGANVNFSGVDSSFMQWE